MKYKKVQRKQKSNFDNFEIFGMQGTFINDIFFITDNEFVGSSSWKYLFFAQAYQEFGA